MTIQIKKPKYETIVLLVYFVSLLLVWYLAFEDGHFKGMQDICKDKTPAYSINGYVCVTNEQLIAQKLPELNENPKLGGLP